MKICIDPGHGGRDPGAVGGEPLPLEEKRCNLEVALDLERALLERGFRTLLTRRRDRTLGLTERAAFANRLSADLFVSIHGNAAADPAVEGMEVFHFPGSVRGRAFAAAILAKMASTFPEHRNRGIREANCAVLRRTRMPAVLVECEFLTNDRQRAFLSDPENRRRIAEAIGEGILSVGG